MYSLRSYTETTLVESHHHAISLIITRAIQHFTLHNVPIVTPYRCSLRSHHTTHPSSYILMLYLYTYTRSAHTPLLILKHITTIQHMCDPYCMSEASTHIIHLSLRCIRSSTGYFCERSEHHETSILPKPFFIHLIHIHSTLFSHHDASGLRPDISANAVSTMKHPFLLNHLIIPPSQKRGV